MRGVEILAQNDVANIINGGVVVTLLFGHCQHLLALGIVEELAALVEQLQGVPLSGVVRCGDDDAAVGLVRNHGHLRAGGCAEPYVDDIDTCAEERALHKVFDHRAREAGIATNNHGDAFAAVLIFDKTCVCRCELNNIYGREVVRGFASYRSTNARNGFNECHICLNFVKLR